MPSALIFWQLVAQVEGAKYGGRRGRRELNAKAEATAACQVLSACEKLCKGAALAVSQDIPTERTGRGGLAVMILQALER